MQLQDRLFLDVFRRTFAFTILFEDSDLDCRYLELDASSDVLAISAAGCGVASLLALGPRSIDAVDLNAHHLAITALKVVAAQHCGAYDDFYALVGRGRMGDPAALRPLLAHLPATQRRYWERHQAILRRGLYSQGLLARFQRLIRARAGVDEAWLRALARRPVEARAAEVERRFVAMLRHPVLGLLARSPAAALAGGVNFIQARRNLDAHGTDDMRVVLAAYFHRVVRTDLERNWIAWWMLVGHFDHASQECLPPFLRRAHFARSQGGPTAVRYHLDDIFRVLRGAAPGTWSHFMLSDAVDWLPDAVQRQLFAEIVRTGRAGGVAAVRTVERTCPVARAGLADRLERIEPASTHASAADRSALYHGVNYYRIAP